MLQFQTNREDVRYTRVINKKYSHFNDVPTGYILVRVDKFACSSNNITVGFTGNEMEYWDFFEAEQNENLEWGCIPMWGFATVIQSARRGMRVGERLYGLFPPSSFLQLFPDKVTALGFVDAVPNRKHLPAIFNNYIRLSAEKNYNKEDDNIRALLSPLFLTSFCLCDYLKELDFLGAKQIIILSASSKTAIGTAQGLTDFPVRPQIVGLTAHENMPFLKELGCYNQVINYENIKSIDVSIPSVIIDMAGNKNILYDLEDRLGSNMIKCLAVGLTHWSSRYIAFYMTTKDHYKSPVRILVNELGQTDAEEWGEIEDVPEVDAVNDQLPDWEDAKQLFDEQTDSFYTPMHVDQRMKKWGKIQFSQILDVFMKKRLAQGKEWLTPVVIDTINEFQHVYQNIAVGQTRPHEGTIVTMPLLEAN